MSEGGDGTGCACEHFTPCACPPGQMIPNSYGNPYCKACARHFASAAEYTAETGHTFPNLDNIEAL